MSDKTNKNWFRRHWIISIILAILVVGIIWTMFNGESDSQNDAGDNQEQTKIYKLGEKITVEDVEYSVDDVFTSSALGSAYMMEEAKGIFVIVSLTVKNNGDSEMPLSTNDFKLTDLQGRNYNPDFSASVYLEMMRFNPFTFERLGAGLQTSGEIVFDVPADDLGLMLEITGEGLFADSVQVDLGDVGDY